MSKRNSDGDVLFNKLSLKQAHFQRLIDSTLNSNSIGITSNEEHTKQATDDDLDDEKLGPVQAGVGSKMLKEIEDGTIGRRTLTSNDKLLEQILGSKAARAHRATKQAPKEPGKPQRSQKSAPSFKPADSDDDDDDEGRSSAFRAKKKRRIAKTSNEATKSDLEEMEHEAVDADNSPHFVKGGETSLNYAADNRTKESGVSDRVVEPPILSKLQQKDKPKSFLDEILAERSNKKKKKKKKRE